MNSADQSHDPFWRRLEPSQRQALHALAMLMPALNALANLLPPAAKTST